MYKDIVMHMPTIGKILQSGREPDNSYDSFGIAIIENYIIILSLDMCLGILLVQIPHHVLNEKSKQVYRKLRGYLFSRFTKYPRNPRNFLSLKIIRPTVHSSRQIMLNTCLLHIVYKLYKIMINIIIEITMKFHILLEKFFQIILQELHVAHGILQVFQIDDPSSQH